MFLAAGFIVFNLLCLRHASKMLVYSQGPDRTAQPEALAGWAKLKVLVAGVAVPRPENFATPAHHGLDYETAVLSTAKGGFVEVWHIPGDLASGAILLFPGYSSCKAALLAEARQFHDRGWDVWLADFRGGGGSSGHDTTLGYREAEDVALVFQHVQARQPTRIVLYGSSMGSAAILRAVAVLGVRPDGVIAESGFDTMLNVVRNRFRSMRLPPTPAAECLTFWGGVQQGFNAFSHNPVHYIRHLQAPLLLLHGGQDPRATLPQAQNLAAHATGPHSLVVFPGAGHAALLQAQPERWREAVDTWLTTLPP